MTFIFLSAVLKALYNSLGEDTVPTVVPASYTNAIQYALERIARLYDFDWSRQKFLISLTAGQAPLDASIAVDGKMDIRQVISGAGNDNVFTEVPQEDFDGYGPGSFRYYISYTPSTTGMAATLVTSETVGSMDIQILASLNAPVISDSIGVSFPSAKIVADFALVYVRRDEDKDADTTVEEAVAIQGYEELVGQELRNNPPRRAKNRYDMTGHYPGEVGRGTSVFWGDGR
jgi:hypothetical protein